jgi:transcriptional regulator with XRE-family HTH domain
MISKLKFVRLTKGIRAKDLARRVGVTPAYISLLERGNRTPSKEVKRRIAKALNFPMKALW